MAFSDSLRLLIAAPNPVAQTLARALDDVAGDIYLGRTTPEAEAYLAEKLKLIIVCYVFDDVRPYRFVRRARSEGANVTTPILLVRALPVPLGESQEWEIRNSYKSIGVDEFVNYAQLVHQAGAAHADEALRQSVWKLLGARGTRAADQL